ncbi:MULTISPECIES: nucleoside recognition domain-containing protein [Sporomusa]|uniref:YjiH family protein n=1 Tax=Sporomusa TaxID=2375 RepID=UPI002CA3013C|nr:nucleoside recognition domain-containing protein [Sporomusa sphaeroides]HML33958.1 hypothetical protein [Sporomusa sphaeroides]
MSSQLGVNPNKPTGNENSAILKFLILSVFGIVFFFVPLINGDTPLMYSISTLKKAMGKALPAFTVFVSVGLLIVSLLNSTKKVSILPQYLGKDGLTSKILYVLGAAFGLMVYFNVGPQYIIHPDSGGLALILAGSILLTVLLAGFVVTFIANFGLLQFVGTLIEPLMRPVYKLPGYAAVDAATSIACSAAVDVFLANKIYLNKLYTKRDVAVVASNFTICSLGFFVVLCDIAGIPEMYGRVALTSFIIAFLMPIITIRIPPLSSIPNEYVDGTPWVGDQDEHAGDRRSVLKRAWDSAIETADTASLRIIADGLVEALVFSVKVSAYVLSIATLALAVSTFTQVFQWIGAPIAPVLSLFGIPNAAEIAPSVLVGVAEIALPALLIAGQDVAPAASFFIVVLSTVQVIFFTESANAIMESDIPLGFWQLIVIFLVRTVIAIPMVALAMHLLF